jgi:hypothetical protein
LAKYQREFVVKAAILLNQFHPSFVKQHPKAGHGRRPVVRAATNLVEIAKIAADSVRER